MSTGKLVVICGPMYSGKTSELLSFVEIFHLGKKNYKAFKPFIDKRYENDFIVSHNKTKVKAFSIKNSEEILNHIEGNEEAVFIDEIQFIDENLKNVIQKLINKGIHVYCSGLDLSFKNNHFYTTTLIMAYADEIIKKKSVCHSCGEYKGTITYKKYSDNEQEIDVGGFEKYISVCRDCYLELNEIDKTKKLFKNEVE